jgi:SHS2 domain-containing protein
MPSPNSSEVRTREHVCRWEHFPHDADIGVRGMGNTLAAAFEQGALALTAVISDPQSVEPGEAVTVQCEARGLELLFVEWLNTLVFEMATRGMIFARFAVSIAGTRLDGTAWGEPVDVARHQPAVEIKGATYTQLRVTQGADGTWVAECVVDV